MNRKILFLFPSAFCLLGGCSNGEKADEPVVQKIEFDEDNIIFSAPLISDEHIGYSDQNVDNEERLDYVFKTLKELHPQTFNAVLSTGDQTQNGLRSEVNKFMTIYKNNFSLDDTPFFFSHGNHDTYWSGCMTSTEFYDAYGQDVYKYDLDQIGAKLGNRHAIINGIDFISLQVKTYMPNYNDFTSETMSWFDSTMHAISVQNPNKPVFVLCHSPAWETVLGSYASDDSGEWGASKQLKTILSDYPNAILLSGHTHYGITDERNIWQDTFTCIQAGSICDLDLDTRLENINELTNRREYSFGYILEIDNKYNVKVTRYDFIKKEKIKNSWIIPSPKDDLSHLEKYSFSFREENNIDPTFPSNGVCRVFEDDGKIAFEFDAFKDDDMISYYDIRLFLEPQDQITDLESYVMKYLHYVDCYNKVEPQEGKIILKLPTKYNASYSYTITAHDSFGGFCTIMPSKS